MLAFLSSPAVASCSNQRHPAVWWYHPASCQGYHAQNRPEPPLTALSDSGVYSSADKADSHPMMRYQFVILHPPHLFHPGHPRPPFPFFHWKALRSDGSVAHRAQRQHRQSGQGTQCRPAPRRAPRALRNLPAVRRTMPNGGWCWWCLEQRSYRNQSVIHGYSMDMFIQTPQTR